MKALKRDNEHAVLAWAHGDIAAEPSTPNKAIAELHDLNLRRRHEPGVLWNDLDGKYSGQRRLAMGVRTLIGESVGRASYSAALSAVRQLSPETVKAAAPRIRERLEQMCESIIRIERL